MTECERIIQSAILPEVFFRPETICDFHVDVNRKKIWAIGVDLLISFDKVCRKYNIKYSLAYGSILGYIRHHGFIPWDDDIDVWMLRSEYNKLLSHADDFRDPYFLQIPGQDHGYYFSFSKLRNINTSCVSHAFRYASFNSGIALDIFPVDNFVESSAQNNFETIDYYNKVNSTNMRRFNPFPTEEETERFRNTPNLNSLEVLKRIDEIATKNNTKNVNQVCVTVNTIYYWKRQVFLRKDLEETIDVDFYGYKIPIPKNYDQVLKTLYGDYMVMPPKDQRGNWHSSAIWDADISYLETITKLRINDKQNNGTIKTKNTKFFFSK